MNDLTYTVTVWGPWIGLGIIVLTVALYLYLNRKNPFFLPRKASGWVGTALAIIMIAVSGAVSIFIIQQFRPLKEIYETTGRPIPNSHFDNLTDSTSFNLSDYRGKVVLLNFWATWCSPCIREMPELDSLQQKFGTRGFVVITASDEKLGTIRKFIDENPMHTVQAHIDSSIYKNPIYAPIRYLRPVTFIIDDRGIIRNAFIGEQNYSTLASLINRLLPDTAETHPG